MSEAAQKMKFISLFAGIGGMDLGLERAGMECVAQVEIDDYCRRVLTKHWPEVPKYGDVRTVGRHNLPDCDLIAGGFPCQDISNAGKRAGIEGERSGLWSEYDRIIREIRPRFVLVENVSALLNRGIDRVLGDLAACGYDAEWDCLPAAAVGAAHERDRLFIVAYSRREGIHERGIANDVAQEGRKSRRMECDGVSQRTWPKREIVADTESARLERRAFGGNAQSNLARFREGCRSINGIWGTEPDVGRVANGIPRRMDRLKGLGNAVVPQVAEYIGRCIMEFDAA